MQTKKQYVILNLYLKGTSTKSKKKRGEKELNKIYLVIYKNCVCFGNFDKDGDFYYYELVRYYPNIHGNESISTCFLDLLIKYKNAFKIEIINKINIEYKG